MHDPVVHILGGKMSRFKIELQASVEVLSDTIENALVEVSKSPGVFTCSGTITEASVGIPCTLSVLLGKVLLITED
jgi:hypothetical protein